MNLIRKLPGPLLVFLGASSLSFGGLIVKLFEGASPWQILFWRTIFFLIVISCYLILTYKHKIFKIFYISGIPGLLGGFILSLGFCGYVFAMYNTSVANVNFILQTQTIFLAIFGYFFLKEKISFITLTSITLALVGIFLMIGNSLSGGQMVGNLVSFIMPLSFAVLILIIRKYPNVDMVPIQFIAGIFSLIIGYLMSEQIIISPSDIFLGFLAGFLQLGIGFILISVGAQTTPSAMVGIIMLTEAVLGPIWAWIFLAEKPPSTILLGGSIVIFAVLLQFYNLHLSEKKINKY